MSHSAGASGDEVPYENAAGREWDDKASALYQEGQLQSKVFGGEGVVSAHVWGVCPRCGHDIDVRPILSAPVPGLRGRGPLGALTGRSSHREPAVPEEVEAGCGCGHVHPQAPERSDDAGKVTGCGVSFHLPTAPPSTPASSDLSQDSR